MKDRLEQFIEDNRDSFDSFNPPPAKKILKTRKMINNRPVLRTLSRAAAVLMIFCLSYVFHEYMDYRRTSKLAEKRMYDIYEQVPELKEAENYYANLVSLKMNEVKPFLDQNPEIKMDINTDLQELDSVCVSLKNDLKDNVANEQIIEAMIQNYRLKLMILEDLLTEIKKEKNKENEKTNVHI